MEYHPDRNYGNVEETTLRFAEVQSAYSILSDPQERAWYDSQQHSLLRDGSELFHADSSQKSTDTTVEDIRRSYRKFNDQLSFSNSPSGFFGGLRSIFEKLAMEEAVASERQSLDPLDYPSFGYAADEYENVVRVFYASWSSFSTRKTFSRRDIYRLSDAPDRRGRRMMEKENKRIREEAIQEYNECVRSMVAFVKKRDPRYKSNPQNEAERAKILRDAASAQAARSRAANREKVTEGSQIPQWTQASEQSEFVESDEEIEKVEDEVHCVVCKKIFKSDKQYESHERSKKHNKALRQIRSVMQNEHIIFGLNQELSAVKDDLHGSDTAASANQDLKAI